MFWLLTPETDQGMKFLDLHTSSGRKCGFPNLGQSWDPHTNRWSDSLPGQLQLSASIIQAPWFDPLDPGVNTYIQGHIQKGSFLHVSNSSLTATAWDWMGESHLRSLLGGSVEHDKIIKKKHYYVVQCWLFVDSWCTITKTQIQYASAMIAATDTPKIGRFTTLNGAVSGNAWQDTDQTTPCV